jgi:hypothetical protein
MTPKRIDDWTTLARVQIEVRLNGQVVCSGTVDEVTTDGSILWIQPSNDHRRLYEKRAGYQVWATGETPGFLYWVSKARHAGAEADVN